VLWPALETTGDQPVPRPAALHYTSYTSRTDRSTHHSQLKWSTHCHSALSRSGEILKHLARYNVKISVFHKMLLCARCTDPRSPLRRRQSKRGYWLGSPALTDTQTQAHESREQSDGTSALVYCWSNDDDDDDNNNNK
jgi:hypothetical protein